MNELGQRGRRAVAAGAPALLVGSLLVLVSACAVGDLQVSESPPTSGGPLVRLADETDAELAGGVTTTSSTSTTSSTTTSTTTSTSTTSTTTSTTTTTEPPPPPATDPPPPPPSQDTSLEGRSLSFVNQKRSENGAGGLQMDGDLTAAAEGWAAELVRRQDLGHNPNLGEAVPDRFNTWGENVAYSSDAGNIDQMWWESDGHRANILNPAYSSIGIAFVEDGNGLTWAVQVFGG